MNGNENCFGLAGGSCYREFELPKVDYILTRPEECPGLLWRPMFRGILKIDSFIASLKTSKNKMK